MSTIVTRLGKGTALTWQEADANFTNLNLDKVEESELASSTGSSMVGYLPDGTGAVPTTVQNKLRETVSVKDFGAVGDGVTDDTAAITNAVSACTGKTLFFPKGKYILSTAGGSVSLKDISIIGEGVYEAGTPYSDTSSCILINDSTASPFSVGRAVSIRGMAFYWPAQLETGAAPIVFPALFTGTRLVQFGFEWNTVVNAYDFMTIPAGGISGDNRISNNRIFAINKCFYFQGGNPEVVHITDNIFSLGVFEDEVLYKATKALRDYYVTYGEWMRIDCGAGVLHQSVDGLNMHGNLVFGCQYGVNVSSGRLDVSVVSGNKFDAVPQALVVSGSAKVVNTIFTSNLYYSYQYAFPNAVATAIRFASTGDTSKVQFVGNTFSYSSGTMLEVVGSSAVDEFVISSNTFTNWGQTLAAPSEYYAIAITDSDSWGAIVGNTFVASLVGTNTPIGVAIADCAQALVSSNQFKNCSTPVRVSGGTEIRLNGNQSSGTSGASSFVDSTTSGAIVQCADNFWDKLPTNFGYPAFSATILAAQTFTGAKTKVNFASQTQDANQVYDPATSTFVAPVTGLYRFDVALSNAAGATVGDLWGCTVEATGSSTKTRGILLYVTATQSGSCTFAFSVQHRLTAGDSVVVYMTRAGGTGNWVQLNDGTYNYFCGEKIQ